jgi:hypothetical protein
MQFIGTAVLVVAVMVGHAHAETGRYVLAVLSGLYSVASTATVSTYSSEQSCRTAGESYVKQAALA